MIFSRYFFASHVFLQDRCQPSSPQLEGEYTELEDIVNLCQSALCKVQGSTGVTWSSGTTLVTVLIECKLHFQSYVEAKPIYLFKGFKGLSALGSDSDGRGNFKITSWNFQLLLTWIEWSVSTTCSTILLGKTRSPTLSDISWLPWDFSWKANKQQTNKPFNFSNMWFPPNSIILDYS